MKRALAIAAVLGLVLLMGGCAGNAPSSTTSSTETTSTTVTNESTTTPGETSTSLTETSTTVGETSTSVSETSTTLTTTQVHRPAVTAVSPRSGPTSGGNVVTITGTGFTGATSVRFGTVTTTHFTVNSSTRITVTVPPQSAGTHDVNVTTPGGRSASSSVDKYTYK